MNPISANHNAAMTGVRPHASTQGPPQHGADLVIDSINPSDSFPFPGEAVYFDVTVHNQGDRDAPPFNVRITSDGLDQEARVKDGLKAGASETLQQMGPLDTTPFQNIYWVDATADPENAVKETRKDNNDTYISIMPQQPPNPPTPPIPPIPIPHPRDGAAPGTLLAE